MRPQISRAWNASTAHFLLCQSHAHRAAIAPTQHDCLEPLGHLDSNHVIDRQIETLRQQKGKEFNGEKANIVFTS